MKSSRRSFRGVVAKCFSRCFCICGPRACVLLNGWKGSGVRVRIIGGLEGEDDLKEDEVDSEDDSEENNDPNREDDPDEDLEEDEGDEDLDDSSESEDRIPILNLLHRSWFERLWTRQEICLANPGAILVCSFNTIPWSNFRKAVFCLRNKRGPYGYFGEKIKFRARLQMIYRLSDKGDLPLDSFMHQTRNCKCSNY
jgi:hypothetical protein